MILSKSLAEINLFNKNRLCCKVISESLKSGEQVASGGKVGSMFFGSHLIYSTAIVEQFRFLPLNFAEVILAGNGVVEALPNVP